MDPSIPFSRPYRVRFDEAGADGLVRPSSLVRYIQDVAWQHSEAAGYDRAWYATRGLGWLIRGVDLELISGAGYGEPLTVTTRITGWRRMWARRWSDVAGADGRPVARAATDWVLLDARGRPVRIPAEIEAFAPAATSFTPIRVDLPDPPASATSSDTVVRAADVDPMGHLNNAAYVDLVAEAIVAAGSTLGPGSRLRLEYLRPALPDMRLELAVWGRDGARAILLREASGPSDLMRALAESG